jgi:hypothetical protein
MKLMMRFLAALVLLGGTIPAQAMEIFRTDKLSMDMYGRAQMIGVGQYVPDPYRDHMRVYLFLKQARVGFKGNYEDVKFDTQFAFGGEIGNPTNNDLGLLDFVADIPLKPLGEDAWLKMGQFRVPYSREGIADRGYMEYGDRSIANMAFYQSRDYGLAVMKTVGAWTGTIGTFSSGSRDVPQRYLPERLGIPYTVVRFGYNDGADEDIYHVKPNPLGAKRTTKAVMFNALYTKDTLIGHSSALQSRTIDKNLLMDSNYNPFINQGGGAGLGSIAATGSMQRGDYWSVGGDAVIHHPLGSDRQVNAEVEANWGGYQNRYGVLHAAAARAQADYQQGAYGIGLRYGLLSMDKQSGFLTNSATTTGTTAGTAVSRVISNEMGIPIHEIAPSLTWRVKGHNMKVVADLPIYINCPLWYDRMGNVPAAAPNGSNPVGTYAFPDPTGVGQNTVLATPGNQTARRTIVQGRMLFQFMF